MTEPTTEKLARALEEARQDVNRRRKGKTVPEMIRLARDGYYDDYKSPIALNIAQLVSDCHDAGLDGIAERAMDGEFDATREESDAWAASPEGQETFRQLLGRPEP